MIGADAAIAYATERQMRVGEMPFGIVDTSTSKTQGAYPFPLQMAVSREEIECQRIGMTPDDRQRLFHGPPRKYR